MITEPPPSLEAYEKWAREKMGWDFGTRQRRYYETVSQAILECRRNSPLWQQISQTFQEIADGYYRETKGHHLFLHPEPPDWLVKPFSSLVLKSFRLNVTENPTFPDPPKNGWVSPDTWYHTVCDIVRARIVVKYLDGPFFLVNTLCDLCKEMRVPYQEDYRCHEDGYYAAHIDLGISVEVPRRNWDTTLIDCRTELQITTQLQEVVQGLMHRYYEQRRMGSEVKCMIPWQWQYNSPEFAANYLGHVVHYLEGMIMRVRQDTGGQL